MINIITVDCYSFVLICVHLLTVECIIPLLYTISGINRKVSSNQIEALNYFLRALCRLIIMSLNRLYRARIRLLINDVQIEWFCHVGMVLATRARGAI